MAHPSFARSANENRIGRCFGRDHSAHHLISAVGQFSDIATLAHVRFAHLRSLEICCWGPRDRAQKGKLALAVIPAATPLLPTAWLPFDRNRSDPSNALSDPLSPARSS